MSKPKKILALIFVLFIIVFAGYDPMNDVDISDEENEYYLDGYIDENTESEESTTETPLYSISQIHCLNAANLIYTEVERSDHVVEAFYDVYLDEGSNNYIVKVISVFDDSFSQGSIKFYSINEDEYKEIANPDFDTSSADACAENLNLEQMQEYNATIN